MITVVSRSQCVMTEPEGKHITQLRLHITTIEDLVPQNHFLRRIETGVDLSFVYEDMRRLYSHKYGRPPVDQWCSGGHKGLLEPFDSLNSQKMHHFYHIHKYYLR